MQQATFSIFGRTNVGKSTLFNHLIGRRLAIESDYLNTTRDPIRQTVTFDQQNWQIVDTPGLDKTDDALARLAMDQIDHLIDESDVSALVVDGTVEASELDISLARRLRRSGKPVILLVNKADITSKFLGLANYQKLGIREMIPISSIHNIGIDQIRSALSQYYSSSNQADNFDPELSISLVGKPNVGKSSLLNALSRHQVSLVSEIAGTTRDQVSANWQVDDQTINLVDTAGIRKNGKVSKQIEKLSLLRTKKAIEQSEICLLVLDAELPDGHLDQKIAGMIDQAGKGLIIIINKWDKIDDTEQEVFKQTIAKSFQFIWWAPIVFVSAKTGSGLNQLADLVKIVEANIHQPKSIKQIDRILNQAFQKHPAKTIKDHKTVKFSNAKVVDNLPLTIQLYGRDISQLHFSYLRYLENQLRDRLEMTGVPIKIINHPAR
ncbi:ribosome biogenesis GTPase Der [Candidatus Saccharibacteria bacterium]|nr:ribosome biogenesis GTPase Der [Candidatus Saccharibacteria bacterium]MCB9834911.1 ribosome biogenesis GTPase Der [Candidatus Nomurabacteria bacterium]